MLISDQTLDDDPTIIRRELECRHRSVPKSIVKHDHDKLWILDM